jgi:hypothetical protein
MDDVHLLTDDRATTAKILERLEWLVSGLSAGDRVVFHFSGHGTQMATRADDLAAEVDDLDEVICPVDFQWTPEFMIRDKELHDIFAVVPPGVHFVWISDACHSEGEDREVLRPGDLARSPGRGARLIQPPADIAWRIKTARDKGLKSGTLRGTASDLNLAFIAACRSNETAADTIVDGSPCGALTHYLIARLSEVDGLAVPLPDIVNDVRRTLAEAGYEQHPQLDGPPPNIMEGFMGSNMALVPVAPVMLTIRPQAQATPAIPAITAIEASDIRAGDVLLYLGTDWISRAICRFDGQPVSHVALRMAEEKGPPFVAESLSDRLKRQPLGESLNKRQFLVVRRFSEEIDRNAITETAQAFIRETPSYASEDILMLAHICLSRALTPTPSLAPLLKGVFDAAATLLNAYTAGGVRRALLSSEFVYGCYDDVLKASANVEKIVINPPLRPTHDAYDLVPGKGVERGSILDALRHIDDPVGSAKEIVSRSAVALAPLETLFVKYEAELATGASRTTLEEVASAVENEVMRLAFAFLRSKNAGIRAKNAVKEKKPGSRAKEDKFVQTLAIQALFDKAKAILTPGDFYTSPSFRDIGYVTKVAKINGEARKWTEGWKTAGLQ